MLDLNPNFSTQSMLRANAQALTNLATPFKYFNIVQFVLHTPSQLAKYYVLRSRLSLSERSQVQIQSSTRKIFDLVSGVSHNGIVTHIEP